ncbi:MAG: 4-hydroxy-3-methylbut-2-enyl diphosphate reductase [Desulfobacterales bacterium]
MKIIVAKTAGFCMGVRRAVEMVLDAGKKYKDPLYTYGPLIHNPQVLNILNEKGIRILEAIPQKGFGTVLIRAHGVPPDKYARLINAGFNVIDATCPRVIKVQTIIKKHAQKGYATIIVGDRDHAEVVGLLGYAGEKKVVIGSIQQLETIPSFEKAIIVAQTTQNKQFFEEIKAWFEKNHPDYLIFDTICGSTEKRQNEVNRLAQIADAVIVVGGYTSGNTQRLYEIAQKSGKLSFYIEDETQLDLTSLYHAKSVGITAGASTPNWGIRRICQALETMPHEKGKPVSKNFFSFLRVLLFTSTYLALGAGCLCYAGTKLQGIGHFLPQGLIACFYVQSMHIFNNLTNRRADRYNDPDKALFYDSNKPMLTALALITGIAGLIAASVSGFIVFLLFVLMSTVGLLYNIKIIPSGFMGIKPERIKDIPASKTLLITFAWAIVTTFFVPLSVHGHLTISSIVAFFWAAGLVFSRTAFFDILDMHGDRMVGRETLPIVMGEKPTMKLLKIILGLMALLAITASWLNITSSLGYTLVLCPLLFILLLISYEKGYLIPGIRLEFLVESLFIAAGILSGIWVLAIS